MRHHGREYGYIVTGTLTSRSVSKSTSWSRRLDRLRLDDPASLVQRGRRPRPRDLVRRRTPGRPARARATPPRRSRYTSRDRVIIQALGTPRSPNASDLESAGGSASQAFSVSASHTSVPAPSSAESSDPHRTRRTTPRRTRHRPQAGDLVGAVGALDGVRAASPVMMLSKKVPMTSSKLASVSPSDVVPLQGRSSPRRQIEVADASVPAADRGRRPRRPRRRGRRHHRRGRCRPLLRARRSHRLRRRRP